MGALVPALPTLASIGTSVATRSLAYKQAQENAQISARQSALRELQLRQDAELQREKIALDTQQAEKDRKDALKRSVARQRAKFGAQGIGSGAGSSQAVLLGLTEESEEERASREALDSLKEKALDQKLEQANALNVLQRTQLQERSRVDGVFGVLNDIF